MRCSNLLQLKGVSPIKVGSPKNLLARLNLGVKEHRKISESKPKNEATLFMVGLKGQKFLNLYVKN